MSNFLINPYISFPASDCEDVAWNTGGASNMTFSTTTETNDTCTRNTSASTHWAGSDMSGNPSSTTVSVCWKWSANDTDDWIMPFFLTTNTAVNWIGSTDAYGVYPKNAGTAAIYYGSTEGTAFDVEVGDTLKLEGKDAEFKFYINSVLKYTWSQATGDQVYYFQALAGTQSGTAEQSIQLV